MKIMLAGLFCLGLIFAPLASADPSDPYDPCHGVVGCNPDIYRLNPYHPGCAFDPYQSGCFPYGTQQRGN